MHDTSGSNTLNNDLQRLSRFGANIADAYGCYIFLPGTGSDSDIVLAGFHSLSNDVVKNCRIEIGHGLIGWVAKHKRSIHVSPFERDSRTLGLYHNDQALKSFIGIPILYQTSEQQPAAGVIACDSKKSFAFSKLQGKLLEDLACEISFHLRLTAKANESSAMKNSWQQFLNLSARLAESLGRDSIEVLRIKLENHYELEKKLGTGRALAMAEQIIRLIEQSLPPHFPSLRLTNGDFIVAVDNMMTSFIENKILALCEHCAQNIGGRNLGVVFSFHKQAANARKNRGLTLEELVQMTSETSGEPVSPRPGNKREFGLVYEYKRA